MVCASVFSSLWVALTIGLIFFRILAYVVLVAQDFKLGLVGGGALEKTDKSTQQRV